MQEEHEARQRNEIAQKQKAKVKLFIYGRIICFFFKRMTSRNLSEKSWNL